MQEFWQRNPDQSAWLSQYQCTMLQSFRWVDAFFSRMATLLFEDHIFLAQDVLKLEVNINELCSLKTSQESVIWAYTSSGRGLKMANSFPLIVIKIFAYVCNAWSYYLLHQICSASGQTWTLRWVRSQLTIEANLQEACFKVVGQ